MGIHGGLDYQELAKRGWEPGDVLDFSVSVYPLPLPEGVRRAFRWESALRYPDREALEFKNRLAAAVSRPPEELLITNGTSQAITLIPRILFAPGEEVLIAGPTYGQYRDACVAAGVAVTEIRAAEGEGFRPPLEAIAEALSSGRYAAVFLCDPNNPTGTVLAIPQRKRLLRLCEENDTLLILDEAYAAYLPPGSLAPRERHRRLLTLRSLTKEFGIPGLRLGYLHGPTELIEKFRPHLPEWSVNGPAQAVGSACLDSLEEFREGWAMVRRLRRELSEAIEKLGYSVYPGAANFFLTAVPGGGEWKRRLWERGILVRDAASFGLPSHLRIGVRDEKDNLRLIEEMKSL